MKWWLTLIVTAVAAASGFLAAYRWWRASKVDVRPFDENGKEIPTSDTEVWIIAVRETLTHSGSANKQAAIWTGISVALAGIEPLINLLPN